MHYPDRRDLPRVAAVPVPSPWTLRRFAAITIGPESWRRLALRAPHWRIYFNDPGAYLAVDGRRRVIPAERVYVIPPWFSCIGTCDRRLRHCFAHVESPWLPRRLSAELWPGPFALDVPDWPPQRVRRLADSLAAGDRDRAVLRCLVESFVHAVFAQVLEGLDGEGRRRLRLVREPVPELRAALACVEERLGGPLKVADLAAVARCSEGHLSRLFTRHLGVSPMAHVLERRVARAAQLLAQTDASIDAIADRCGFSSRSYFTRVFTRLVGRPPATYRRAAG